MNAPAFDQSVDGSNRPDPHTTPSLTAVTVWDKDVPPPASPAYEMQRCVASLVVSPPDTRWSSRRSAATMVTASLGLWVLVIALARAMF